MGKSLMIMGTASSVGKSVITAGLCRLFYNKGYNVNPFKSQNMALNSYITQDGKEMGRAQVVQAEAAGKEPDVKMNPVLIKPNSDKHAQIIVMGKIFRDMDAVAYHSLKPELKNIVSKCYKELEEESDLVIIEGAGSPAEINLRDGDIVNMGMAEISDSPVILVGDIDKGGVFASLYGTVMLLPPKERARIKGVIINKFRGDIKLLDSGLKMLEDLINIPVLGVIPWHNIDIEDEDSVTERFVNQKKGGELQISILKLPYMSNYTDFAILETIDNIIVRYIECGEKIGDTDIIIIPGSKSVTSDLIYIKENGWDTEIYKHNKLGKVIFGICGGYQMLGMEILDPELVEGSLKSINGLGLLSHTTIFKTDKITKQTQGVVSNLSGEWNFLNNLPLKGYEIHMGRNLGSESLNIIDNCNNVFGTYLHGVFDNLDFTLGIINKLLNDRGVNPINSNFETYKEYKDDQYNKLANILGESLNIPKIMEIIEEW